LELILAAACDAALERADGKLDLTGIFNELHAPGFPAMQENMTVVFIIEWGRDEQGTMSIKADLTDDAGQPVLSIQGGTEVEARPLERAAAQTRLVLPLDRVVFPHPGRYTFRLTAGDRSLDALSLFVSERAE
jgi:hypothetical protein